MKTKRGLTNGGELTFKIIQGGSLRDGRKFIEFSVLRIERMNGEVRRVEYVSPDEMYGERFRSGPEQFMTQIPEFCKCKSIVVRLEECEVRRRSSRDTSSCIPGLMSEAIHCSGGNPSETSILISFPKQQPRSRNKAPGRSVPSLFTS